VLVEVLILSEVDAYWLLPDGTDCEINIMLGVPIGIE